MTKTRNTREYQTWDEPIPVGVRSNLDSTVDFDESPFAGRFDVELGRPRLRANQSKHSELSMLQMCEMAAAFAPTWETAAKLTNDGHLPDTTAPDRRGRPSTINASVALVIETMIWIFGSSRNTFRQLDDRKVWKRLRKASKRAWPDHPERRLPRRAPSRHAYNRFRPYLLQPEAADAIESLHQQFAAAAALDMGHFQPDDGSLMDPSPLRAIAGDGTWLQAMFNTTDERWVDPTTGEIFSRRTDPDATPFHTSAQRAGNMLVTVLSVSPHSNERILLAHSFCAKGRDAHTFVELVAGLQTRLPGIQSVIYDMAFRGQQADQVLKMGILPIHKLPRRKNRAVPETNLGPLPFRCDGRDFTREVVAYNGRPCVITTLADGSQYYSPLELAKIQRNLNRGRTEYSVYAEWRLTSEGSRRLDEGGAITRIAMTSKKGERGRPSDHLRLFPEGTKQFNAMFGYREGVESNNHHIKQMLPGTRTRHIGLAKKRLSICALQTVSMLNALYCWARRTGGDLSRWFGALRPPGLGPPIAA
jgi:hypothetical protein